MNDDRTTLDDDIANVVKLLKAGGPDLLYEAMGPRYKMGITKENFIKLINAKWKVRDVLVINYEIYEKDAFVIIKIKENDGMRDISSFRVWFWKMGNTDFWVPQNLPFSGTGLPSFINVPNCLADGF